jgi:hypothetical protein
MNKKRRIEIAFEIIAQLKRGIIDPRFKDQVRTGMVVQQVPSAIEPVACPENA